MLREVVVSVSRAAGACARPATREQERERGRVRGAGGDGDATTDDAAATAQREHPLLTWQEQIGGGRGKRPPQPSSADANQPTNVMTTNPMMFDDPPTQPCEKSC